MKSLWQIMVPCNWNDGRPVRTRHHKEWDKRVRKISKGLTVLPPARGQWVDPNSDVLYEDRVIPVNIICTEKEIDMIADITIQHYDQLAAMYFKLSDHAIIKERS